MTNPDLLRQEAICGNCGKPYSQHYIEDEVYCFTDTTGDIFTDTPSDNIIFDMVLEDFPGIYDQYLARWQEENGHISEDTEMAKHPQADLLEKLDMIKEAVERNPDEWWKELEVVRNGRAYDVTDAALWDCVKFGDEIRLKPQRVKVEGEVDAEVIRWADYLVQTGDGKDMPTWVAQALLDCVKEEGDGLS